MDMSKHIKQLNSEVDWPLWKHKIRDLLDYHEGALDAIDGKLTKPEPLVSDATEEQKRNFKEQNDLYRKANSYSKSMLAGAVSDAVYQKIMDKETAHDTWEALKQQFEATSKDQLFKICTDLFSFNWTQGDDASTHVAKLRSLWNELNNGLKARGEGSLPDLILVCKALHILPNSFETFKTSWMLLTKNEDKTFDEMTMQLLMFERNFIKKLQNESALQEALVVNADKAIGVKNNAYKRNYKNGNICNYCKKKGHWVKNCRNWIADGRPSKNKGENSIQSNSATTNVSLISMCNEFNAVDVNFEEDWWIDNGATKHVTNSSKYFINFEAFDTPAKIKAAGKEILSALGKGTIRVISKSKVDHHEMTLNEVWYAPEITRNLFSVIAAQERNVDSEFTSTATKCHLKIAGNLVLCGQRHIGGTLYKADIKPIKPNFEVEINAIMDNNSLLKLYHERWGHQDKRHIKCMIEKELGIVIKMEKDCCEPCIYGKAHRLPFGNRESATKPGELMSTDVCGPFDESYQKKRYLVVFKDNYTKYRYGYIIKEKSEVKNALQNMLAHMKTLGHSLKELLSDNGGEFDNREIKQILNKNGITQRLTAPYTPQQNGASERENRTIIEMARTLKYSNQEADFSKELWAELVSTAIYILNRTRKSSEKGISPYELWIGKKPRIRHLRVIGSICYTHIPCQKRKKMDRKAIKGYLIGYDNDERYRIWLKESKKVILSRDVEFIENRMNCEERVQLPLRDVIQEEKDDNKKEIEENNEEETQDKEFREEDEDTDKETTSIINLRDRSKLKRPTRYEDYLLTAEEIIKETDDNPETYTEAIQSEHSQDWRKAMNSEISSLNENNTWDLTNLPEGAKTLKCRWVFCVKRNPDGSIDRYKARLVVKGFTQREGIDYNQTFSPVAKLGTIRSILSISANEKLFLKQFDVSTAFLYGKLQETIYMEQPEGFNDDTKRVCRLKRSLYGLKQASRCWNRRFGDYLKTLGFKVSDADPCLYIRNFQGRKLLLVLYVDDGLVAASNLQDLDNFLEELKIEFKIKTQEAKYFLGLEIERRADQSIKINQKAYAKKILQRFNFSECKAISTPMLKSPDTSSSGKEDERKQNFPYRQAVGAIMYLMLGTRPDLAYSVGFVSRSLENPTNEDIYRIKRIFRYIAGTLDLGVVYSANNINNNKLECYSDADFGGCTTTGRSTSGVVVMYAGGAITWLSQRQAMVATSTTEAEIVAANEAAKEIIWLTTLFKDIATLEEIPILQVDNSAAVRLAQNPEYHRRTKHIAIKHFFIREKISEEKFGIQQIPTELQIADLMTKPLPRTRLMILSNQLGLQ